MGGHALGVVFNLVASLAVLGFALPCCVEQIPVGFQLPGGNGRFPISGSALSFNPCCGMSHLLFVALVYELRVAQCSLSRPCGGHGLVDDMLLGMQCPCACFPQVAQL